MAPYRAICLIIHISILYVSLCVCYCHRRSWARPRHRRTAARERIVLSRGNSTLPAASSARMKV